jgi:hypothetical protein
MFVCLVASEAPKNIGPVLFERRKKENLSDVGGERIVATAVVCPHIAYLSNDVDMPPKSVTRRRVKTTKKRASKKGCKFSNPLTGQAKQDQFSSRRDGDGGIHHKTTTFPIQSSLIDEFTEDASSNSRPATAAMIIPKDMSPNVNNNEKH